MGEVKTDGGGDDDDGLAVVVGVGGVVEYWNTASSLL